MKHPLLTLLIAALALPGTEAVFAQSFAGSVGQPAFAQNGQSAAGFITRDGVPALPGSGNRQSQILRSPGPIAQNVQGISPLGRPAGIPAASPYQQVQGTVTRDGIPPAGGVTAAPLPEMPGSRAPEAVDHPSLPPANSPLPGLVLPQSPGSAGPANLTTPIDPLTGVPLHMTSQWPQRNGELQPLPPPTLEAQIPSPIPHARIKAELGNYPVRPLDRVPSSDLLPTPDLPHLPGLPGPSYSGPVLFDGRVDGLIGDPLTRDPDALPLDAPPNPDVDFPQDTLLDPSLFDYGNNDGQLDWIDLIEEYAGRLTRGDIPEEPHNTPKEDRSWLRIEHWRADATWFPATGDDLGWFSAFGNVTIGLPKIRGLTITPAYSYHMFEGPKRTDFPNTLHDLSGQVAWMRRFDARWRLRLSGTVGFYSDHLNLSNGLRFSGQSLVTYECNPDLQIVGGIALLNLENRRMLPVGGIIWFINDRHRLDLIFPEWKFAFVAQETLLWTKWAYATGGFWGRTWEIDRAAGGTDDVTYSDWRVAVGMEKKGESDIYSFLEVGVAFDRKLDYESNVGDYNPGTFGFVRGGFHF